MSICDGIDKIIDRHLGVEDVGKAPHYVHKTSCLRLSKEPPKGFSAKPMLFEILECLEKNWGKSPRRKYAEPSNENWRFKPKPHISKKNVSLEKILEKKIANIGDKNWVNQVPTASGLWDHASDKLRNIDLVHRLGPKRYEFIELKIKSDTPLKAAVEILVYGMLYIFSRRQYGLSQKQDKELLQAETINLRVLAPLNFYDRYNLAWLEVELNSGLKSFLSALNDIKFYMDFRFETFPANFDGKIIQNNYLDAFHKKFPVWNNKK